MFTLIARTIERNDVLGVFVLMLIENLIPIIPSELILPLAGFEAAQGRIDPLMAWLAATLGSSIGGTAWYGIGYGLGLERFKIWSKRAGRWLPLSPHEIDIAERWFAHWGGAAVLIGRTLPGVRGVISVPPGLAQMKVGPFLLWSTVGAGLWSALLMGAGYLLNANYTLVERWLNPVADAFLVAVVLAYIYRVVRGQ